MKILLAQLVLILLAFAPLNKHEGDVKVIKVFLSDLQKKSGSNDALIKKYFSLPKENKMDKADLENRQVYLEALFKDLNQRLQNKNLKDFKITPYILKEQKFELVYSNGSDAYLVYYKGEHFLSVLLRNGKLKSATTMNKGATRVFLEI